MTAAKPFASSIKEASQEKFGSRDLRCPGVHLDSSGCRTARGSKSCGKAIDRTSDDHGSERR